MSDMRNFIQCNRVYFCNADNIWKQNLKPYYLNPDKIIEVNEWDHTIEIGGKEIVVFSVVNEFGLNTFSSKFLENLFLEAAP